ncbi:MAG: wax ester/triacylglycerol synthase family O-acyltransferase, partial [bacterium]|nr:wax ester/triacylglycerol synthase family O-acyltransferase [bacterium]
MPYSHYDRLTALDTTFLDLESNGVHMHVGSVATFEPGPLATPEGGIDFAQILRLAEVGLNRAPRFRQKLGTTPISGHPVWIDDDRFNLTYHVRHTALPLPGDERRLKRLAARIMSQKLDRSKPMWELWFVEGLEGGRFAVISKVHHCLIDGLSGVELLAAFMGPNPSYRPVETDHSWRPRRVPSPLELLGGELRHRVSRPGQILAHTLRSLEDPAESIDSAVKTATGFVEGLGKALSPASETPLNVPIGPYRRFDWTRFDLDIVKEVKEKVGGTINDVVLACVSGAMRRFLQQQGTSLRDIDFRVFVPVSTRTDEQRGTLGNRVSMLVTPLPVDQHDRKQRMDRVIAETRKLKTSRQAKGTQVLEELSDWTSTTLLTGMSRMAAARRSYNMVVTNVPGPNF